MNYLFRLFGAPPSRRKAAALVCDHRYCYRDTHCTKCGERYRGPGEPVYTAHFTIGGRLVPEDEMTVADKQDLEREIKDRRRQLWDQSLK